MATEQFYQVSAHSPDQPALGDLGIWDKRTGGDSTIQTVKHRAGGLGPERMYPTLPTYSALVVSRVLEEDRGDWELSRKLRLWAGKCHMSVTEQPLDEAGHPYGDPIVYYGRLSNIKTGQYDSNGTAVRMLEFDVEVETVT